MNGPNPLSSSKVIPKPWGYEYCAYDSGYAAVWILHIARGRKTSRHCHPNKHTRLVVLQGEVVVNERKLGPLESVELPKGIYHQSEVPWEYEPASENGAFIMEIEEPSNKSDILRENDAYGRAGKPIESETFVFPTDVLKLSSKSQSAMGYRFQIEKVLGGPVPDLMVNVGPEILGIYKEKRIRVADAVAQFVRGKGVDHVFGVVGGGSMHLNDAFREIFIPMHHEQAASFASEAYARLRGFGVCLVTTGPGGTNAMTGLACAWTDCTPVMFISGQVTTQQFADRTSRQMGVQGLDIARLVRPITKFSATLCNPDSIPEVLERAYKIAKLNPSGPVWIDIPLDIQGAYV